MAHFSPLRKAWARLSMNTSSKVPRLTPPQRGLLHCQDNPGLSLCSLHSGPVHWEHTVGHKFTLSPYACLFGVRDCAASRRPGERQTVGSSEDRVFFPGLQFGKEFAISAQKQRAPKNIMSDGPNTSCIHSVERPPPAAFTSPSSQHQHGPAQPVDRLLSDLDRTRIKGEK